MIDVIARIGYAARGTVYLIVGGLALLLALNGSGRITDSEGAITALSGGPFGIILLAMMAIGLSAFAIWRTIQATYDVDHHGRSLRGLVVRTGITVSGISHALLAFYAVTLATGYGTREGSSDGVAATVMSQPFGRYLLAAMAICVAGASIGIIVKGARRGFRKYLTIPPNLQPHLSPICTFGLLGRGFVFSITAGFFLYASFTVDPSQAGGLGDALRWLRHREYGTLLFSLSAAGLFAFGAYGIIEAIWRKVDADVPEEHIKKLSR